MSHTPTLPLTARLQRRVLRTAVAAVIATAAATVTMTSIAAPAFAHDELTSTELITSTSGSPESVQLTFSNSIIEVGTEVVIRSSSGADAAAGDPVISGPTVTVPLEAGLAAGEYSAAWRVVSSDGHPIEGAFTISVAADGSASIGTAAAATDHHDAEHADDSEHGDHAEHGDESGHGDHAEADASESGTPVGALIAVGVGGVAVIGGGLALATIGRKRRAQAMADEMNRPSDNA